MDLLNGYDSDSGTSEQASDEGGRRKRVDSDGSTSASDDESVDSATRRAQTAAARLRDYGQEESAPPKSLLPSALDAFDQVQGVPEYLDPQATRPLAAPARHGALAASPAAAAAANTGTKGQGKGWQQQQRGADYDVSRLAPPLKGDPKVTEKRTGAVIEGKAKKYKLEERGGGVEARQQYTAAQIAMMGGEVALDAGPEGGGGGGPVGQQQRGSVVGPARPPAEAGDAHGRHKASAGSPAMVMEQFIAKGVGGAKLPRRAGDRAEREKAKREKGQSTHSHWKSETEMALRQQYD